MSAAGNISETAAVIERRPCGPSLLFFIRHGKALTEPSRVLGVFSELVSRWGGVACFRSGLRHHTYVVSDPAVARCIFEQQDRFAKYPHHTDDLGKLQALIGKGMLATHTDCEWQAHRRSVARDSAKRVVIERYSPVVARHVKALVASIAERNGAECNFSELAMQLSGRIMSDILAPDHEFTDVHFLEIKRVLDQSILEFHRRDFVKRAQPYKKALNKQAELLVRTAVERKHQPSDGLVARIMADEPAWQQDSAARQRLLDRIVNMVVAGYETTATTMSWIVYLLATHPDVQGRLYEEVHDAGLVERTKRDVLDENVLLQRAVQEAMRLRSVLWFNIRYATKETTISGYRFDAGSRVMLLPFLTNRDPHVYSRPDRFHPDRYLDDEPLPLHPFGHGPRVCIGRTLAELEMQQLGAAPSARFSLVPASHPKPIGGVLLQPDTDVLVRFISR